jgi:hypothetical protein
MNDRSKEPGSAGDDGSPGEKNRRDVQGFEETPAPQGLKIPPRIEEGEDSGEWTRGGGSDPNEIRKAP